MSNLSAFLFSSANLTHLRIPFSVLLMPVYLFALAASVATGSIVNWKAAIVSFVVFHIFMYPASNAFNSFFDRDEESIGGLKTPPKVEAGLWWLALLFDLLGLLLASLVGLEFFIGATLYCLASRAYSYPKIRLKSKPVLGWLTVFVFQGAFVFCVLCLGFLGFDSVVEHLPELWLPALASSLLFGGAYPITQVYQHDEDERRGDLTISRLLGIEGTFLFSFVFSIVGQLALFVWMLPVVLPIFLLGFAILQIYPAYFFSKWWAKVRVDSSWANFEETSKMSQISAWMSNVSFGLLVLAIVLTS
ncbi:MAG: UbiA family prenyltransferase [Pseudomonadota bacterium]